MATQRKIGDYILTRKLGSGQYSKVREGLKDTNKYAVKYMNKTANPSLIKTCLDLVLNEVKVMSALDHPNIIKLHEYSDKGVLEKSSGQKLPVLYLVLDLVTGGELFDSVASSGRFSEKTARHYFKQLIEAVEFRPKTGFAHRDIKAENLLLSEDYTLKLADVGFSAPMDGKDGSGMLYTGKGTEGYMAPEILGHEPYSGEKVDLFAVGVLLFIMVAQHPPFRKAVPQDPFYKMFCQRNEMYWNKMSGGKPPGTFTPDLKELINSLMAIKPEDRYTISEIKKTKWYNGPDMTPEELNKEFIERKAKVVSEWKQKAEEALAKKKVSDKSKGFGLGPHIIKGTKAVMSEDKTLKEEVKNVLPIYKVPFVYIHSLMDVIRQCFLVLKNLNTLLRN